MSDPYFAEPAALIASVPNVTMSASYLAWDLTQTG